MSEDKNTREQLLESAKSEFAEKGYMKASLRKICAGAGVTTGALYFFFKDKEDLFTAIVGQPFDELKKIMIQHFANERDILKFPDMSEMKKHIDGGHDEITYVLIHHLYSNYDAFMLLLTKSQGSKYESCVDEMVEMTDSIYSEMAENIARHIPGSRVNKYIRHWLSHMIIDAFIHLITHEPDESKAVGIMSRFMDFYVNSWIGLVFEEKKNNHSER